MAAYGRHRQSIIEIESELHNIFNNHPESHLNDSGEPVIPADSLVDVFRAFSEVYNGVELLSDDELSMLKVLLASNPGLEVTPQILLQFIAEKTKTSPPRTPNSGNSSSEEEERGRADDWNEGSSGDYHRRSSSNESNDAYYRGSGSRPPSRGPPSTPLGKSFFDSERRQRSTPLGANPPSTWNRRPAPASRRKSDAGSRSDSESGQSSFRTSVNGRSRAPSNPTSPSTSYSGLDTFSPVSSPGSRPHSRTRSQPQSSFSGSFMFPDDHGYTSPEENHTLSANEFNKSINSLSMPHAEHSDDEEDDENDMSLGLVMEREITSSNASLQPLDRLDVLQRANAELSKKLREAETTLANRLSEHEIQLEDMEGRLEEKNSELSAAKREEKELRSKERQNTSTIAALEMEVSKLSKQVEHSRSTYNSLQKQYQEQCALSEKYRDDLRQREETIRSLREAISLHEIESGKWAREQQTYEDRIAQMEHELALAQQAHEELSEQKQENLLLKETIDRMRFDMDELRNNVNTGQAGGASGHASAANTISKSLGAELMGKMKGEWGMDEGEEEDEDEEEGSETTAVEEEESEGEDVIQTIITRKKRKVASRANKIETRTFEEVKEYSDSSTQYEPDLFYFSHGSQTDPELKILRRSFSTQTPPQEAPANRAFAIQTDPEPIPAPRVTIEMEIQTEETEEATTSRTRSPSPHDESLASSSSTIIPPTPKAQNRQLEELQSSHQDQPPAYNQITAQEQAEREWTVAAETLKKWHHGANIPLEGLPNGISEETIEEWKALKEELGVDCMVIDKIIEASARSSRPSNPKDPKVPRRGRLYNIYNTYIFGDKNNSLSLSGLATQAAAVVGVSAFLMVMFSPYMAPQYNIPGGPTAYDRSAWSSFNSMQATGEGFGPDGTAAVWSFLGRVGIGAARMARGWPT